MEGLIVKAVSGFYYVQSGEEIVECRARGRFRKDGVTPLVGDRVTFTVERGKGTVRELLPRRNAFIRPAVANLDALVVLASAVIPVTEPFLIDRITAIAGEQNVPVLLCVNKVDLNGGDELAGIYRRAGYPVFQTSAETGEGIEALREAIQGKVVAVTGNSGVGTRRVVKENLQYAFPDFAPYLGGCQFNDCAHLREPGCKVVDALERGAIEKTRYDSYVRLYERAKEIKEWERR